MAGGGHLLFTPSAEETAETNVKEHCDTNARAHIIGRRRNEGYSFDQLRDSSLMEEEVEAPLA